MTYKLLPQPFVTAFDASGASDSGATMYFYLTTTTTSTPVYSTSALSTPLTQPLTADSAGRFPVAYLNSAVTYRVKTFDSDGVLVKDVDPLT